MFWIIETKFQLEKLYTKNHQELYIDVIPVYKNLHPVENKISTIYLKPPDWDRGYMLCLEHSESLLLNYEDIFKYLKNIPKLYVLNKKEILHYLPLPNLFDITFKSKDHHKHLTQIQDLFEKIYRKKIPHLNKLIPLPKLYESCDKDFQKYKDNLNNFEHNQFINNKIPLIFSFIEKSGIYINKEKFSKHFYKTNRDWVYTNFNLKTDTLRPSNTFDGINYMALSNESGCKESFIPRNDYFIEFDIQASHPSLIAKLIDYDFKGKNPHEYLAELYNVDYKESKFITFRQIYGGIYDKYKDLEFFNKTQKFIDELWDKFNSDGYIKVPISNHKYYKKDYKDLKPQKLFNLYLQSYEISLNVLILWDIIKILKNKRTKIVHFVYDSFLFDVSKDEENLIKDIKIIFKNYDLKLKKKVGFNYNFS